MPNNSGTGLKAPANVNSGTGLKTPSGTSSPTSIVKNNPSATKNPAGITSKTGAATGATTGTDSSSVYQYPSDPSGGTPYDDNGNLMPGWELDENNDPVWVGTGADTTGGADTTDGGGTSGTRSLAGGDNTTASADGVFLTDSAGNIYDSNGDLVQYADGSTPDSSNTNLTDVAYTDDYGNTYNANGDLIAEADHSGYIQYDDQGNSYDWDGNFIAYAEGNDPNIDNTGIDDTTVASNEDDSTDDSEFVKTGGLMSMKNGGMPHFVTGGFNYGNPSTATKYQANGQLTAADPVQLQKFLSAIPINNASANASSSGGQPISENSNSDGSTTQFFDDGSSITYDSNGDVLEVTDATDTGASNGSTTDTSGSTGGSSGTGNRVYYDDGSSVETFDDGSTITYDSNGDVYSSTQGYQTTVDDYGNSTVTDGYGNIVSVYDPQGNVIPLGGGRATSPTSITSTSKRTGVDLTPPKTAKQLADEAAQKKIDDAGTQSALDKLLAGINTKTGAGVTGGVLGALLGSSDLFGGSSGQSNAGIDMSKVGVISPRTTNFGIGPANYVGYDEYGTPQATPELYGNELYQNLNAPGFNEVNPGDYAAMDAQNNPQPVADTTSQGLADGGMPDYNAPDQSDGMTPTGGLPQGGLGASQTFYTFGKAVDPMQNLYNPQPMPQQPAQQSPQGMPPQAAQNQQQIASSQPVQQLPIGMPQGAPQGQNMGLPKPPTPQQSPTQAGPQGLRSGGLPAWSNVPITDGRLNFRDGAPVHGAGDGQSDDIPAMLADGEYVIDADTVAQIGNGSTKAGAQALDKFRENIRAHKRSAPINKIPPKTKALTSYLRGAK
jgi:hypothetical protein